MGRISNGPLQPSGQQYTASNKSELNVFNAKFFRFVTDVVSQSRTLPFHAINLFLIIFEIHFENRRSNAIDHGEPILYRDAREIRFNKISTWNSNANVINKCRRFFISNTFDMPIRYTFEIPIHQKEFVNVHWQRYRVWLLFYRQYQAQTSCM